MNKTIYPVFIIGFMLVLIVLLSAVYVVDETNQVIITRFGEPKGDPVVEAGLHFKVPFLDQTNYFDKRLLDWDGDPNRVPTEDKKYIWIDSTARWRINDPLKFLQAVQNERSALSRLDDILDGAVRNVIAKHKLIEIVRSSNRILDLEMSEEDKMMGRQYESIEPNTGRRTITQEMLDRAFPQVKSFGIELVDLRLKRINYDQRVRNKVFERMISERKRAAELLRAEGRGRKAEIEGARDKELQKLKSEAYRTSQGIRGKADAEVTKIYAEAFSKDPEFYSFINTLETYRSTFNDKNMLVLSTDSEYYKYLNGVESK